MSVSLFIASLHYKNQVIFEYIQLWMRYIFKFSREISQMFLHQFYIISDFFLKLSGGIPGMFVHFFQIITNFLFVCQSVSWLTSLLSYAKIRIFPVFYEIFILKIFGDIPGMLLHYFQINANCLYVCKSVSWLTSLQMSNKCRDISCSERDIFLKFF